MSFCRLPVAEVTFQVSMVEKRRHLSHPVSAHEKGLCHAHSQAEMSGPCSPVSRLTNRGSTRRQKPKGPEAAAPSTEHPVLRQGCHWEEYTVVPGPEPGSEVLPRGRSRAQNRELRISPRYTEFTLTEPGEAQASGAATWGRVDS